MSDEIDEIKKYLRISNHNKVIMKMVYQKYGGRCAYCGRKIKYKDMQIDYADIISAIENAGENANELRMPCCNLCYFNKGYSNIEQFRDYLEREIDRLEDFIEYKLASIYGFCEIKRKPIQFYFERFEIGSPEKFSLEDYDVIKQLKESKKLKERERLALQRLLGI